MFSTILVAVPALRRVEPAISSGPTAGAICRSTKFCSSEPGQQVTKMIFAPALRARVRPPRTNGVMPLADTPMTTSAAEAQPADAAGAFFVVVLDAFLGLEHRLLAAGHDRLDGLGGVPKVGGISAASTTPSRPLVPAPMKMTRPPLRSAWVMISMPCAIRSFSFWTAAMTLRSSLITMSTMSRTGVLSIARLTGLMASVGSDCHLDCVGMQMVRRRRRGNRVRYSRGRECQTRSDRQTLASTSARGSARHTIVGPAATVVVDCRHAQRSRCSHG